MFELNGIVVDLLSSNQEHRAKWIGKEENFRIYGEAINSIVQDNEGRMWAVCDDEPQATQINFNPFTGEPAKVKRKE